MSNGFKYTLGTAAKKAGVSKSTVSEAVKKGQLSVAEKVGNGFRIDPAELDRWMSTRPASERSVEQESEQTRTLSPNGLEQQIEGLKALLNEKDHRISDLETDRDAWREQARTLALTDQSRREASQERRGGLLGWFRPKQAANG